MIAGVEIDARGCRLLLVSLAGEQVAREFVPLDSLDMDAVIDAVGDGIDAILIGMPGVSLLGCGVAVPGIVDQLHDSVDCARAVQLEWRSSPAGA